MFEYEKIWKSHRIETGETFDVQLGPLRVLIHRDRNDWYVSHGQNSDDEEACTISTSGEKPGGDRDWTRWILSKDIDQVKLKPCLPERPIIVRPGIPMGVMPKQTIQFFVDIPIKLALHVGSKLDQVIEIPSVTLSNSWFGPFTAGELCYSLKTPAKLHLAELPSHPHRVIFPLEIRNVSNEILNFERLCLRPQYLKVYQGDTRLWTNRGRVSYRGETKWSRIVYASTPPEFDGAGPMLSRARENLQRGVLLQTFDNLKQRVELI